MRFVRLSLLIPASAIVLAAGCENQDTPAVVNPYAHIKGENQNDSLLQLIRVAGRDTFKAKALSVLCWNLRRENPDTAIILGEEAVALCEELQFTRYIAKAHSNVASPYRLIADYKSAMEHNELALQYAEQLGDSDQIATSVGNIGTIYYNQGNYPRALEQYLLAMRMGEQLNDTLTIATQLTNIGTLFIMQHKPDSAVVFYTRALILDKAKNDFNGISFDLGGIAAAYGQWYKSDTALIYYMQALAIEQKYGSKYGLQRTLANIGTAWAQFGEEHELDSLGARYYDSALVYYEKAQELATELNDRRGIAINMSNRGHTYAGQRRFKEAESTLLEAEKVADSLDIPETKKDIQLNLSVVYDSLHNTEEAYRRFKTYVAIRDSLVNTDKSNQMTRAQMNFQFETERAVQEAKNKEERERQQLMLNAAIGGGLLLLIVAVVSIRAYRTKKRSNEIISQQKLEVENQKALVETKQKEIIDSINYAQRIQTAILPAASEIEKQLKDAFVLYLPKDIVSGDFYWLGKTKQHMFIAAADCTGHGVPGGFMSMLGTSLLNEVAIEKQVPATGDILDLVRLKIITALKQTGEAGENKDGMDIALCRFGTDFSDVTFSCANNPLWICRPSTGSGQVEMLEFKADKQPVGISVVETMQQFRTQHTELYPGDCIYMFTDGYADQFGGPKGKKFKYKALKELLVQIHSRPMHEQRDILRKTFEDWKGSLMQIDDVLIIGIRIS